MKTFGKIAVFALIYFFIAYHGFKKRYAIDEITDLTESLGITKQTNFLETSFEYFLVGIGAKE